MSADWFYSLFLKAKQSIGFASAALHQDLRNYFLKSNSSHKTIMVKFCNWTTTHTHAELYDSQNYISLRHPLLSGNCTNIFSSILVTAQLCWSAPFGEGSSQALGFFSFLFFFSFLSCSLTQAFTLSKQKTAHVYPTGLGKGHRGQTS